MADLKGEWALILGASSGFGAATSVHLARCGMNIAGVHLDRRAGLENVQRIRGEVEGAGGQALFFNVNAADDEKRAGVLNALRDGLRGKPVRIMLHSLAFGTLKPYIAADPTEAVTRKQLEMTLDVMANSLVYWVQDLVYRGFLREGSRVFAMTSSGDERAMPNYGPVSAAKAALDAHVRQLAVELAPRGISVNALRAGITDTPSLRKIPGHETIIRRALEQNPHGRLTKPEDVAQAIAALSQASSWVTGNVINVDGGEFIV